MWSSSLRHYMNEKGTVMEIKLFVMDVDGTLTDGKIYMGENGEVCKAFNIKDGYGIHDILIPSGIIPVIITGRQSKIVENRCRELGITEIHQGVKDKVEKLREVVCKYGEELKNVAYIGDDLNDMPSMEAVKEAGGFVGCPADAVREVKEFSDYVASGDGGNGAVREFIVYVIGVGKSQ